jgi:hypothetical protein
LWKILDGFKTILVTPQLQVDWDKKDGKARANILLHLKYFQLFLINDLKTSKEMWDGLFSMFETKHVVTRMFLKNIL